MLNTEQAQSYKLRALWFTPEVIGASARQIQLQDRLTEAQTCALVEEAETPGYTVNLVDLDPDEGSGVIPPDWAAFLVPRSTRADAGTPLFSPADAEAELTVRIRGREERVRWPIPESIRKKMSALVAAPAQNQWRKRAWYDASSHPHQEGPCAGDLFSHCCSRLRSR